MHRRSLVVALVATLAGCSGGASPPRHVPPAPPAEADATVPVEPDASAPATDAAAPLPPPSDSAPPAPGTDAAPEPSADAATPPSGMRVSLQAQLASKWNGPRESTSMEAGTMVFTGAFEANKFGGPQGHTPRLTLDPGRDYLFEYRLRFDTGFDFSRGGKIPGLAGGSAPTGCVSTDGSGFSARMMWRQNGKLIGYIYDLDQRVDCGEGIDTPINFKPGQWYAVKERVRINTARNHDGILQIWIDDQLVIDQKTRAYMIAGPADRLINQVLFHSFFGGSTQDWAPSRPCSVSFSDPYATRLPD